MTFPLKSSFMAVAAAAFFLLTGLSPRPTPAAIPGIDNADFRGSSEKVLATLGEMEATEHDMFVFAIITEAFPPELAVFWENLGDAQKAQLRAGIEGYFQMHIGAGFHEGPVGGVTPDFEDRQVRLLAGPAAKLVWADKVVRNQIHLFPEDIIYRYHREAVQGPDDDMALIRRMIIPVEAGTSFEERNRVAARLAEIRKRAIAGGGLQAMLEEYPEYAAGENGGIENVLRRDDRYDSQVRAEAFRLGIAQISQVLRTPSAMVLVEVVDRVRPPAPSLNEMLPTIREDLRRDFLPQQFVYRLGKIRRDYYPINRGHLSQFMPGDADILRVNRFAITLDEFNMIHPELAPRGDQFNKFAVLFRVDRMIDGEVATQEIERLGFAGDPLYEGALGQARLLQRVGDWIRHRRTEMQPGEEELREWLPEYIEEFQPGLQREIWRLQVEGPPPALAREQGETDALRLLMMGHLERITSLAGEELRNRFLAGAEQALLQPGQVVDNLPSPPDDRFNVTFRRVGLLDRQQAAGRIEAPWEDLEVGSFTAPVLRTQTSAVSYYTAREIDRLATVEEPGDYIDQARFVYADRQALAPIREKFDLLVETHGIQYDPSIE